jgi:hypothetical protein
MESCLSLRAALHRRLCSSAVFVTFDAVRVRVVTWSAVLVQAYSQRSDHLAVVAAYNGWVAARAAGGRSAGADFARQHFLSEQVHRLCCWDGYMVPYIVTAVFIDLQDITL